MAALAARPRLRRLCLPRRSRQAPGRQHRDAARHARRRRKRSTMLQQGGQRYVACIDKQLDDSIARSGDKLKPEQKADMQRIEDPEAQRRHRPAAERRRPLQRAGEGLQGQVRATPRRAECSRPAEADALIGQHLQCLPIESLPLAQCAGGVLRENIYAERDQPPFDRVAMDGIALDSRAVAAGLRAPAHRRRHRPPGDPPLTLASPTGCIEVMTGAVSAGRVRQRRPGRRDHDDRGGEAACWRRECVSSRGRTCTGAAAIPARERCSSPRARGCTRPEIAIAACAGMARIRVSSQPMLAVISTGNELVEPGEPVLAHQVRRSNAYAIVACAARARLPARRGRSHPGRRERAARAAAVSPRDARRTGAVGRRVHGQVRPRARRCWKSSACSAIFHKVAQRPGKPLWFGVAPSGAAVFGLPGNPVSTLVCLGRYVLPALFASLG